MDMALPPEKRLKSPASISPLLGAYAPPPIRLLPTLLGTLTCWLKGGKYGADPEPEKEAVEEEPPGVDGYDMSGGGL